MCTFKLHAAEFVNYCMLLRRRIFRDGAWPHTISQLYARNCKLKKQNLQAREVLVLSASTQLNPYKPSVHFMG